MKSSEELKAEKDRAVEKLRGVDILALGLEKTDPRIAVYLNTLSEFPEEHNLYEILAAVRFCEFLGKYKFDGRAVRKFVRFYEALKFSGLKGRRSYKMTPVQVFQFASMLGFYEIAEDVGCVRLTREVILFVPRKFSKTTSTAALAVFELLFGDANAQAYTGANSYKQAQICFKEIKSLAKQLDGRRKYFKATREHIEWKQPNKFGKESFVECLSGGADTKDGLAASLVIMDEYAQAKFVKDHSDGASLLNVLRSSMGTRREPLTVIITTASRVPDGPFSLELESAKQVLSGEYRDDHLFAHIFEPDAWDLDDLGRSEVWKKCNPHIGVTVSENFYRTEWDAAQRDAERMLEFRTKLLNIFSSSNTREWIPRRCLQQLSNPVRVETLTGQVNAMCAIDLSVSDDFSAVTYSWFDKQAKKFKVKSYYFIPEETLKSHPNRNLYRFWVARGWLQVCGGAVINYQDIITNILETSRKLRILRIGYDAYKSQEVVNALSTTIGARRSRSILCAVPQTYGAFTSPVETFEMLAKKEPAGVEIDDNPINLYCFSNAYLDKDRMENTKPVKRKENLKIDGAITTLMTFWLWNNYTLK